ncbi:MAG: carbamoyl-phosphate synthase large subunit [Lachnospiraceae bacterium]|nr:carbamoyl-phosphate synthase large subunit [Lachnospiraceae bacterium]
MAKRTDIKKVLIIGSGPIIIGQACEFDYSGTQACKALKKLGYEIVLVNSNPATIMTDPGTADVTYIEPLNEKRLEQIIEKERPDAILPNLGGQSGLNLCSELGKAGILDKYGVKVIGVQLDAIERGEDRIEFKKTCDKLGIEMARSEVAYSIDEALEIADRLGYPVVLRPAYTMGGAGGGLVYNKEELKIVCERGIQASLVGQVLVEESIIGWEELELEVVRDAKGHMITVCFIENIDPMGVHTGDSFCAAPMLTISQETQKRLQEQAYKIVNEVGVIGGTNVQFAHDPVSDRIIVIEINPRTSRSSALASKATGFPIALVSAMLAAGLTLDEIPCGKYGSLDKYVPDGDYVVIKFARWAFEKFKGVQDKLGTQMRAVGEVMSIGKTYKEAFQKAIRSLENGRFGLGFAKNYHDMSLKELMELLREPSSNRQFIMYEAIRKGASIEALYQLTKIKIYFLQQMKELVEEEEKILESKGELPSADVLRQAKKDGFSDKYIADILGISQKEVRNERIRLGIVEKWEGIHVSGTENSAYYYSSYNIEGESAPLSDSGKQKIMILGGGPNRIGQGIEFDYCSVHAALALKKLGFETIIVNCNPETVSTDYDTSDKLYFEPLTLEDVLSIYNEEKPAGVIAQFGGQTPLNLAAQLSMNGVRILGTSPEVIDLAEDRDRFRAMMEKLNIPMPEAGMAVNVDEALETAHKIGFPVMVRPSYVLGGRGMEVVYDDETLVEYMKAAVGVTPDRPILIDRFLRHATECEADAICDGTHAYVPAVMEHIELAGIHSGDSACIIPSLNLSKKIIDTIEDYTRKIAEEMHVEGLMNMQYAIENDKVYVIEANPRASRTVPLVSKVCDVNMVPIATEIITRELTGRPSPVPELKERDIPYYGVKEAVFPFNMFPEVDPILGPEMRSTGEVLGISDNFGEAYIKAWEATKTELPLEGTALISVCDRDKTEVLEVVRDLADAGFKFVATGRTYELIKAAGFEVSQVYKLNAGRPNVSDVIINREVSLIINTPAGKRGATDGSFIRKSAIREKIPYLTTMAAAKAAAKGILAIKNGHISELKSLQELHSMIK